MRIRKEKENDKNENEDLGDVYEEDDMVIYKAPDGKIKSCGFDVNSVLLRQGKKPMYTIQNEQMFAIDDKVKVSDLFKNMAVPAGLFYMESLGYKKDSDSDSDVEEIPEDIYEKLLNLVENKKKHTRKRISIGGKRKTKKTRK